MYEGVNVGDKDFSALISKMKEAGVSIIYWGGLHRSRPDHPPGG